MQRKWLLALLALLLATVNAHAAADRGIASGNLSSVISDANEEFTEIYQNLTQPLDSVAGTNIYTASVEGMPALAAYIDGNKFRAKIPNTNTSATVTLDIDSLGAIAVKDRSGNNLAIGALASGTAYLFEYFGGSDNHFRVMSPLAQVGEPTQSICVAMSDEVTNITTGTSKVTIWAPFAFTITSVFAGVSTVSSSGVVTVDINEDADAEGAGAAASILSTKLTIDANERRSSTAAAAAVLSDTSIAQFSELTFDIDTAGTGARGLKTCLIGTRTP